MIKRSAIALLTVAMIGCGGGKSGTPTAPSNPTPPPTTPPAASNTITITANGVSPKDITVSPGTRVTFVNNDTISHEMNSDPHPNHGDCPEIDAVGFLAAGQTKLTGNLNTVRRCGFHDHTSPGVAALQGSITIR